MPRDLTPAQLVQRSLNKRFRKELWTPFVAAVKRYGLLQAEDRVAVCVSGSGASLVLAQLLMELQRHSDVPFDLCCLAAVSAAGEESLPVLTENAALLQLPLEEVTVPEGGDALRCLQEAAQARRCTKLAVAQHFDDVVETALAALLFGGSLQSLPPITPLADAEDDLTLIRPLYTIRREDIAAWGRYNHLYTPSLGLDMPGLWPEEAIRGRLPEARALLQQLSAQDRDIPQRVFASLHRVHRGTFPQVEG